jgi:hypothetical protein
MTVGQYCRRVESYMCQKNDGHLMRIVGPTFDLVRGWADGGIPISVVERAIDRTYSRYYAVGTKRRSVRVEYCEQEVIVLFDEWKRAVGIGKVSSSHSNRSKMKDDVTSVIQTVAGKRSFASHLDEVAGRLETWSFEYSGSVADTELSRCVAEAASVVSDIRIDVGRLRGASRTAVLDQLNVLDEGFRDCARSVADDKLLKRLQAEAIESVKPFRSRMSQSVFDETVRVATDRLLVFQVAVTFVLVTFVVAPHTP